MHNKNIYPIDCTYMYFFKFFLGPTMNYIYSDADQIRSTSGDLKESNLLFSKPGIQITDLDVDIRRNLVYWTSGNTKYIILLK